MQKNNSKTNQIKENLIATLRAVVGDETCQVEFNSEIKNNFFAWDQNLFLDDKKVVVPELSQQVEDKKYDDNCELGAGFDQVKSQDFFSSKNLNQAFRASCDLASCYLLFHDKSIHRRENFTVEEQKFFDEFEKIRVLAEVKNFYQGIVKNILHKIEEDIFSGSTSLSLILLNEIFSKEVLPKTKNFAGDLIEKISSKVLQEIKNLSTKTANQTEFAGCVVRIIELLKKEQELQNQKENEKESVDKKQKAKNDLNSFGQENVEAKNEENFVQNGEEENQQLIAKEQKISELKEDQIKGEAIIKLDESGLDSGKIEFKNAYKIFTSKFDEVIFPQKLVDKNELELLRGQLDLRTAKLENISKKMSLKLKKKLLAKQNSFVERDSSRGILDRKKLTRIVIDPISENIWVNNQSHQYQNTVLTILLDNSGSMRGQPIVMSALACEIISEILEKFLVKTEIIGFTTSDWKGGKARKLWEGSGRTKNPGRLNDLRHIVYKHFNQSFKKSKINLGLMLKEGLLKENIDGEALLFARSRLMQQSEKRKILIVISDGTPVDDSTSLANEGDILSDHLHHVINKIEKEKKIEIVGIGIGHATDEFYQNSIAIKSLEELGDVMISKIVNLL